jgi:hypothetical protein
MDFGLSALLTIGSGFKKGETAELRNGKTLELCSACAASRYSRRRPTGSQSSAAPATFSIATHWRNNATASALGCEATQNPLTRGRRRRPRGPRRSVDRRAHRPAIEPRKNPIPGAETVQIVEDNMSGRANASVRMTRRDMLISLSKKGESLALWDGLTSPKSSDKMKGAANSAFVEPEREYGPVP